MESPTAMESAATQEACGVAGISVNSATDVAVTVAMTITIVMVVATVVPAPVPPSKRVKAPSERAREGSEAQVGIVICPWIPIPARAGIGAGVLSGHLVVGFSHVL